jgi:CMP/dCMP kinase
MTKMPSIVVNGDLGSGKTTVSEELARRLDIRRVCVGDLYRDMARRRGMTALQLNLHAELDDEVDGYVDRLQRDIAQSGDQLVVDSRLAWHFFSDALKVHLITEPTVAGRRVMGRPASNVEHYFSFEDATDRLRERSESERMRFISRYGVDKSKLKNYSVVCDTTTATPDEVIERITQCYSEFIDGKIDKNDTPVLFVDPQRIYPTEDIRCLRDAWEPGFLDAVRNSGRDSLAPISVGYTGEQFFVLDGHRRLSAALRCDYHLIAARLVAEGNEAVPSGGLSAVKYFESEVKLSKVYDWEAAHNTRLPMPAHALPART